MNNFTIRSLTKLVFFALALCGLAAADTFNSSAAYAAATSGLSGQTLTFESQAPGSTITSGSILGNITFNYSIGGGGFDLQVESGNQTTSGTHYLGVTGDGVFLAGDSFTMVFAGPVNSVGLFVIGVDFFSAGDFSLSGGGQTALSLATPEQTLSDHGKVFFLGLTSNTGLSSVTLSSKVGADFLWNVDDINTKSNSPVPEPGTLAMFAGAGLMGLRRLFRSR